MKVKTLEDIEVDSGPWFALVARNPDFGTRTVVALWCGSEIDVYDLRKLRAEATRFPIEYYDIMRLEEVPQ